MARAKSKKTTKETTNTTTDSSKFWFYRDTFSWQEKPMNMAAFERLAEQLYEWSQKKDSFRINDFYDDHGINPSDYYRFCGYCPQLQSAHELALRRIASRREIGALTRKLEPSTVFRSLAYYDHIDKEMIEHRASVAAKYKANLEGSSEQKVIVIERMPSSDRVPKKK